MIEKTHIRWKAMLVDPGRTSPLALGEGRTPEDALRHMEARLAFERKQAQDKIDRFDAAASAVNLGEQKP